MSYKHTNPDRLSPSMSRISLSLMLALIQSFPRPFRAFLWPPSDRRSLLVDELSSFVGSFPKQKTKEKQATYERHTSKLWGIIKMCVSSSSQWIHKTQRVAGAPSKSKDKAVRSELLKKWRPLLSTTYIVNPEYPSTCFTYPLFIAIVRLLASCFQLLFQDKCLAY